MKELIGSRDIYNRSTSKFESSDIYRGVDQKNHSDFETLWRPLLKAKRGEYSTAAAAAVGNVQDAHWKWVEKTIAAERSMALETFALEASDSTQGLMLVDTATFARIGSQRGLELVYIELLASAPWNRPMVVASPKYTGVGRLLVATAIALSVELGFKGRVGLHSLPQAESFYRDRTKFQDLGYDEAKSMRYFEITPEQAMKFLEIK